MLNLRRVFLVVVVAGVGAVLPALLLAPPALGQKKVIVDPQQPQQKQPDHKPGTRFSAVKLIDNKDYQNSIDQAIIATEDGDWTAACIHLQAILDSQEDFFADVETRNKETGETKVSAISVKLMANNLLAKMPPNGLNTYELKYGGIAKQKLDEAKSSGSPEMLAGVASRYRHTKAGLIANELLATYFLDRSEYFKAALQFERLIGPDPARTTATDLMLLKATLAFKQAGDLNRADDTARILMQRINANGGLALANGQMAPVKQVKDYLSKVVRPQLANINDWPYVGGTLTHTAQARGSPPMLDYILWSRPTLMDKSDDPDLPDPQPGSEAKPYLLAAIKTFTAKDNMPVMSGGFPIATNGYLVYRTYDGIAGVAIKDMVDKEGNETKAGHIAFRTTPLEGSLAVAMNSDAGLRTTLTGWIDGVYTPSGFSNLLYENSTVGTLTTDSRNVYAVDDLAVPIPPKYLMQQPVNFWINSSYVNEKAKPLVKSNTLWAFGLPSGRIVWKLGGDKSDKAGAEKSEFIDSHFICAPVAVGGKLYVLNEKNSGDLRLVCLDPTSGTMIGPPQMLGTVRNEHRYFHDIARRVNAIHLAYGEGILVCPTNAGEIIGVDLLSRTLAWAYPYRQKPPAANAFPGQQFIQDPRGAISLSYSNWKVAPPMIADGKVVFTAPDASAVHCINLRDGSEVWTAPQLDSDLYLAGVYGDKVVIVGKNSIRAVRLADGAPVWNHLQTGDMPSGQGVASNDTYYLPLRKGEILAVDLDRWMVKAHNRASKADAPAPGNLVFYEGVVLSQTPLAVVAYPQLAAKLRDAEIAFNKVSSNENRLALGEMRLADGQVQKAVDDLQVVLKNEPADSKLLPRTKNRLYEALTDLLTTDFDNASKKYLTQYQTLCADNPAEKLQRETRYLRILAQGRESQGNLVEAFLAYKEYGSSPLFKEDGIPTVEDPLYKVPTNLWLRGRISAMFEKARNNPQQQAALEKKIAEEWASVKDKDDVDAIRQFTGMFDVPFAVGREARVELANVIISKKEKEAYLEAELNLQQLRTPAFRKDPAVGGRALEALARLEKAKGTEDSLRLAAEYYRELHKEFPKDVIAGKKTGNDLFNALAEDPRLRPFLEEQAVLWGRDAAIKYRNCKPDEAAKGITGFVFQPTGDLTPLMRQHRLVLDPTQQQNPKLMLVDTSTNTERWTTTLGTSAINYQFFAYLYNQSNSPMGFYPDAHWRYFHVKGHIAVLQVGMLAYGVDLDNGKVLWQHQLYDPNKMQPNFGWQMTQDEHGQLWVMHNTQMGQVKVRIGQVGCVQATYAALVTQKGLVVLDPITGKTLWTKPGLASNTEIFGDDQHIFYVELAEIGAVGAGRCLRASDGANVDVPDFGFAFRHQQRIIGGRYILTAETNGKTLTMRLVDALTGKDKDGFKRTFENNPAPLKTEDWYSCGVVERDTGKLIVVDLRNGKEVVTADLLQYRITQDDLKELDHPLFLDDGDKFYVALNSKIMNNRILSSSVSNNFKSGARCLPVNGWFIALDRKGEFLWHGHDRYQHQLVLVEQFKTLPVLLFSSRYMEMVNQGQGYQFFARTGSVNKLTGKAIKWTDPRPSTGTVHYEAFNVDLKAGTVNMVGPSSVDQWYVDEAPAPKKDERGGDPAPKGQSPDKVGTVPPQAIRVAKAMQVNEVLGGGVVKELPRLGGECVQVQAMEKMFQEVRRQHAEHILTENLWWFRMWKER